MTLCLETIGLSKSFGGVKAVSDVNLTVESGQVYCIIGPNGAGKTTFFNLVSGIEPPTSGRVLFNGQDVTGKQVFEISRLGAGRTFQNIRLFGKISVLENVLVGMHYHLKEGLMSSILATPGHKATEKMAESKAREILDFVGMAHLENELAENLPYGSQRRLEIVRALVSNPKLLMLDEPTAGMNPKEALDLMQLIRRIRELGPTILFIEHNIPVVMGVSNRIMVLSFGKTIAEGTPEEVRNNPQVIEAYLGPNEEEVACNA
ncbi:MAG: ABC transporter ATP-binding protein [Dehalobacterium sp.]